MIDQLLIETAKQQGFPLAGVVDFELAAPLFAEHVQRYDTWIQAGMSAEMSYLVRGRDRRADPTQVLPEAQSMLCVGMPYSKNSQASQSPRFARYLNGPDYHHEMLVRLEKVMEQVAQIWNPEHPLDPLKWKVCVDTSAVLERSWAALAGLGWIGKNTLLMHPQWGSFLFLGEVLLNQKTGVGPKPLSNYCGHCTRCLSACPTAAFAAPQVLDANRCVSYWTLEKRGELTLSEADRAAMGTWVAGCDICQEVCPFNQKELKKVGIPQEVQSFDLASWVELLSESPEVYARKIQNSALSRVKQKQFSRNVAIALSNAVKQIQNPAILDILHPLVLKRCEEEADWVAKLEWQRCLVFVTRVFGQG